MWCPPSCNPVIALFAIGLLLHVALQDLATRTIPDRVTLCVALLGVAAAAARGSLVASLPMAGLLFGLLLLPWFAGLLGGGDVKLIPAITLLVPPSGIPALLCVVSLAGGVLAIVYLLLRRLCSDTSFGPDRHLSWPVRIWRVERWRIRRRGPIPYAVAIAAGTLIRLGVG